MPNLISRIQELSTYQHLLAQLKDREAVTPLTLLRAARPALLAALAADIQTPILVVTDRLDRVSTYLDEIHTWNPDTRRLVFSEPTPMFYEDAPWGNQTRKDRLETLLALSEYHLPGQKETPLHPIILASAKAVMARTMSRREFLKAILRLKVGSTISFNNLAATFVRLGYQSGEIVAEPGQYALPRRHFRYLANDRSSTDPHGLLR